MERNELKKIIEDILIAQLSEASEFIPKMKEDDLLVNNLGLKSADGIYFTFALSDAIGIDIDDNNQNPYVDMEKGRDRTFGELVDWASTLISAGACYE